MSTVGALVVAVLLAALVVAAARSRPVRKRVGGWISTDKQGRTTIAVTPAKRKKRKRRKR